MAIEYVHETDGGDITVKWEDGAVSNEIHVENTISDLLVQDLLDACRSAEDSLQGSPFGEIARASGKQALGTGVAVGITVELLGTWRVYSTKSSGGFTVLGGNLIKSDGSNPFRPNNQITYYNVLSAAATIVTTDGEGGGGGGGFTTNDRELLTAVYQGSAPLTAAVAAAVFAFVVDGTVTFAVFCKKILAIIRGNADFDIPTHGTNRIRYKNEAGQVEETHEIKSTGRTVT